MMRRSTSVCREEQRRRRDSNPRYTYVHNGFQNRPLQPLGHASGCLFIMTYDSFLMCTPVRYTRGYNLTSAVSPGTIPSYDSACTSFEAS